MQAFTYMNIFQTLKTYLQGNSLEYAYSHYFGGSVSDPWRLLGLREDFYHILGREFRHQVDPNATISRMH
jgi:hypothetical protein